jgi:hypothetical protein
MFFTFKVGPHIMGCLPYNLCGGLLFFVIFLLLVARIATFLFIVCGKVE